MGADNDGPLETGAGQRARAPAWERALGVGFFGLLVMMVGNIGVLLLVWQYNDTACRAAVLAAAEAILAGDDKTSVMRSALVGLNKCAPGGYFIERPIFTQFKDENTRGGRSLRIETTALARLPAPFLMPNANFGQDGRLPVSRSYVFQIGKATGSK
jgi:hypothetical protein